MESANNKHEHLHNEILNLVREERALTSKIIEGLQRVADEKIHLKMGYPTLFAYCNQALGYSEACAYRRIATVRIARELPEIKEKLDDGALSLTTLAMAQTLFRREQLTPAEKRSVLKKIENKSKFETEKILLQHTEAKDLFMPKARFKMMTHSTTQIQLTVNNDVIRKLNRIKALRSHKNPNLSYENLINDMCDFILKKIDPNIKNSRGDRDKSDRTRAIDAGKISKYIRYIPAPLRSEVWMRDGGRCTYRDAETGKQCDSSHFLEIDHIQPIYAGGKATLENLRLLCRGHNQIRNLDYS